MANSKHTYSSFEGTEAWLVLEKAIKELVGNDDIRETTDRRYIVGYLAKSLSEAGILKDASPPSS